MSWISFHIFHNHSFEKILSELILPMTTYLKDENLISAMFFIRYWEKGSHIRYRLLPSKNCNHEELKEIISAKAKLYFDNLQNSEIKHKLEFNDYIQETQRYGGEESIHIAEKHFQDSSNTSLELIKDNIDNWDYSKAISFALQMHIIFAKQTINDIQKSIQLFESIYKNWLYCSVKLDLEGNTTKHEIEKVVTFFENSYIQQKEILKYLIKTLWQENQESKWIQDWTSSCKELNTLILNNEEVYEFEYSNNQISDLNFTNVEKRKFIVFDSFIHMTNNRLGIHLRDEAFIAYLIIQGLNDELNTSKSST